MKLKSRAKAIVEEAIEREHGYLSDQEVGTDEYNASQRRLIALEEKLAELERTDMDSKENFKRFILDIVKVVGGSIVLPLFGLIVITAQEREITYVGAMKSLLGAFVPGKRLS